MYKLNSNYYKGIYNVYFDKTINSIIDIGKLDSGQKKILDFGCGYGQLKKKIKNNIVFNYDIDAKFTDFNDWKVLSFDYLVANQVFYLFSKTELNEFLDDLKKINPKTKLIIGISYQNLLSKILKNLLKYKDAHKFTKLSYDDQLEVFKKKCNLLKKKDNFFLNKVFLFELI